MVLLNDITHFKPWPLLINGLVAYTFAVGQDYREKEKKRGKKER